jgi:hypothetical protein
MVMIFQPKGAGTVHKEGTVLVQAPRAAGTGIPGDATVGWYGADYTIDTYVSNLPTTGQINEMYAPTGAGAAQRFTGCAPCLSSCGPC